MAYEHDIRPCFGENQESDGRSTSLMALFQDFQPSDGLASVAGNSGRVPEIDTALVEPVGEFFEVRHREIAPPVFLGFLLEHLQQL